MYINVAKYMIKHLYINVAKYMIKHLYINVAKYICSKIHDKAFVVNIWPYVCMIKTVK